MHGIPYRSQFEPYYELVRDERRARKTWQEIAQRIMETHGINTTGKIIQAWFKRRQRRKFLPLGFEDAVSSTGLAKDDGVKKSDAKRIEKLLKASAGLSPQPPDQWNFGVNSANQPLTKNKPNE